MRDGVCRLLRIILTGMMVPVVLSGCSAAHDYSDYRQLPDAGWAYNDTAIFVPAVSPAATGDLMVGLRHSADYPYRNLWLEVTYITSPDSVLHRDTLDVELADRFGLWLSRGVGASRQIAVPVRRAVNIDSGRAVTVRHIMRLDTLPKIEQIGVFIIEPAE